MTPTQQILEYWRANHKQFVDSLTVDVHTHGGASYQQISETALREVLDRTTQVLQGFLENDDPTPVVELAKSTSARRAANQIDVRETMYVTDAMRTAVLDLLDQSKLPLDIQLERKIEQVLHEQRKAIIGAYSDVMREAQQMLAERDYALAYQGQLIQELSTPIVPIYEGVLVLPLTGAVDSRRATQIMEAALEQIVVSRADVLILDITGVPVVDTGVANYLIQMARAVNLLGAQVVLVGIGAEIAQTIVQLGVELRNIVTRSNLQAGIEYALRLRGYAIRQV
ncbi:MAG: STAS domain-containing protein [Chloroflexi bacterium SZAS-1]|mgnify:CR=1 FL=1|jgi:rsbT co-antagonist protein RsbR|nr:STAS domain-containing protein [Chloroflexi bacterium SZAS-1]HNP86578.1 STAS domain-containing protein [Kouleothrix sp.]